MRNRTSVLYADSEGVFGATVFNHEVAPSDVLEWLKREWGANGYTLAVMPGYPEAGEFIRFQAIHDTTNGMIPDFWGTISRHNPESESKPRHYRLLNETGGAF